MGIPGLINELGSGHRISLAKFCLDFFPRHSRPPRVAIDVSIWLFQAQAGRGGANPELRTLFYRLERLVALPVHPLFVFDGPDKPEYKRGKLVCRSENAAAYVIRLAKRLIELFKFPWHVAPGEAEAECSKLQTEGVVDAVMSDDVDAVMFGSTVTLRNFSKEPASGTKAATHVNVCRVTDTADGEENVFLDQGGMILFAMLSGGDYLPTGVPKCGPKLAGEIARAKFGTDLLEIIRENSSSMDKKLGEWRERLNYELQTNESGHFKNKHKAVQIPDTFPDAKILFDYVWPVTSSRAELKKLCGKWVWDRELDVQQLRTFLCEELGWNYLLGAKRLIRTIAPQLVSQRLRLGDPVVPDNTRLSILRQRQNFGLEGMSELKLQYIPSDVVKLDLEPLSSQQNEPAEMEEEDSEDDQEENSGAARKQRYRSYDPNEPDSAWISEMVVRMGLPDMVASWHAEQKKKEATKSRSPTKSTSRRKGAPKVVDPTMTPGAILRFGTIVKGPATKNPDSAESPLASPLSSGKPPDFTHSPGDMPASSGRSPRKNTSTVDTSSKNASGRGKSKTGDCDLPSNNNIGTSTDFIDPEEGISQPPSPPPEYRDPNSVQSFARHVDRLEARMTQPSTTTDDRQPDLNARPSSGRSQGLSSRATQARASKQPINLRQKSTSRLADDSPRRPRGLRQHEGVADQASTASEPNAQSALETPCRASKTTSTKISGAKNQPSQLPREKTNDALQVDADVSRKKQSHGSVATGTNKPDHGDPPTRRRISGVIETHDGTWTYRPKTKDEATSPGGLIMPKCENSSQPSTQKGKNSSPVKSKSKRITRVSILDLT